jgi:hypothetical protein
MSNYSAISATSQIKVGGGKLIGMIVSSTSTGTITFYDTEDSNASDPVIIATLTPAAGSSFLISSGLYFNKGLYAVIANTLAVTIVYE